MHKEIKLAEIAADFESGTIEEWRVGPGDAVQVGDVLLEVSTEKALVEVEAEEAGTIGEILVPAGTEDVEVNTPIATLLTTEKPDATTVVPASVAMDTPLAVEEEAQQPAPVATTSGTGQPGSPSAEQGDRTLASPVAKRIARQLGVALATLEGSGPNGRIVLGDVEAAAARQGIDPTESAPRTAAVLPPSGTYEELPENRIRQVIADRLTTAKRDIPHFYLTVDCNLDALLLLRQQHNASAGSGQKLSVNDFFVKASAMALRETPEANVAWSGTTLLRFNQVDIAVAVDTPRGLTTPVIRRVDDKLISEISQDIRRLADRARDGRLSPNDYKGGSFTVSNLGMFGVREFAAIINPPQACILAVGAAEPRVVARNGEPTVATMVTLTLSVDHRAVDGAAGAKYLQALIRFIASPKQLLE